MQEFAHAIAPCLRLALPDSTVTRDRDTQATSRDILHESDSTLQDHGRHTQRSVRNAGPFGRAVVLALYGAGRSSTLRARPTLSIEHDAPGEKDLRLPCVPQT